MNERKLLLQQAAQLQLSSLRRRRRARAGSLGGLHVFRGKPDAGDLELPRDEPAAAPGRRDDSPEPDLAAGAAGSAADRHFDHRVVNGLAYNAPPVGLGEAATGSGVDYGQHNERFSMSYITGSHAFKVGVFTQVTVQGQAAPGGNDRPTLRMGAI
jgi:hypothetical protein